MYNEVIKAEEHAAERRQAAQAVQLRKQELEAKWQADPRLPVHDGWIAVYSAQYDRCYFANPETGESVWKPPHPRPRTAAGGGKGAEAGDGSDLAKWKPDGMVKVKDRRRRASCLLRLCRFLLLCLCPWLRCMPKVHPPRWLKRIGRMLGIREPLPDLDAKVRTTARSDCTTPSTPPCHHRSQPPSYHSATPPNR